MDEGRFNLSKLTEKVRSYLEEQLPELAWVKEFKGAAIPNVPTGTVAAGEMEFVDTSKGADMAVVAFSIYLIDPSSEYGVEDMAMDVRQALTANDTLDDMVQHGAVTKMQFGAVTGRAGACLITYKAKVWM